MCDTKPGTKTRSIGAAAKNLISYVNVAVFGIARDWHRHRTLRKP